ncbi:MAG: hypothetical protein N2Z72_03045 [Bacteroidales bacterium]|nr:hypothetical protein [Bacteroidales bacterium]
MDMTSEKRARRWQIVAIVEAVLIAILVVLLMLNKKETRTVVIEKQTTIQQNMELKAELDSLLAEHEKIKQQYGEISGKLAEKDSIIMAQAKEIEKLINSQADYYRIKKKLDALRRITQSYVHQIDSLYRENLQLQAENKNLRNKIEEYTQKTIELEKEKEELSNKITSAAYLSVYNIVANAYNIKSGSKEQLTNKAKKTDLIRICFTVGENPLVQSNDLEVYIRIARPDNIILSQGSYSVVYQGKRIQYSTKTTVRYKQKSEQVCVDYLRENLDLPKGKYQITLFTTERELGTTFLLLE